MEAPRAEDVIAFLTARGFAAAAAALRDDLISRRPTGKAVPDLDLELDVGSELPPLRLLPPSRCSGGENAPPSAASSSSDAFASLYSSPSELMNPYGVWSPARPRSDDELTNQHSEFGTAREYNNYWYDDQYGGDPFLARNVSGQLHSEDKFIMCTEAKEQFKRERFANDHRHEHDCVGCEGRPEMYNGSFPICDCCCGSNMHDKREVAKMIESSSTAIYGRYQI
ncbi:hypothetical protein Cni_G15061 [Canna indica]|uniref:Uncharacterized protein n=1 Tax=Canna indica TaxID=4628 RepID=A0AAQ3QCY5_9LILI|nr:hypothetical protein Cni_G15061 [Canna indica]